MSGKKWMLFLKMALIALCISIVAGAALALMLGLSVGTFGFAPLVFVDVMCSASVVVLFGAMSSYWLVKKSEVNFFSSISWSILAVGIGGVVGAVLGTFVFPGPGTFYASDVGAAVGLAFGILSSFIVHQLKDFFAGGHAEVDVVEPSLSNDDADHSTTQMKNALSVNNIEEDKMKDESVAAPKVTESATRSPSIFSREDVTGKLKTRKVDHDEEFMGFELKA